MRSKFLLVFSLIPIFVGCGATGSISGTVTCNGKPVVSGTVMVASIPGRVIYARIEEDGTFIVKEVATGEVLAAVNSPKIVSPPGQPPSPRVKGWIPIPPKYNDLLSSGLTYTVESGENSWDIILTDEEGAAPSDLKGGP